MICQLLLLDNIGMLVCQVCLVRLGFAEYFAVLVQAERADVAQRHIGSFASEIIYTMQGSLCPSSDLPWLLLR